MKTRLTALILLVFCTFSGCFMTDEPYAFRQEFEQIVSIEILKKEYDSIDPYTPMDVIKVIPKTQHQEIIDALLDADGGRNGLNPVTGFGMYIVRITYKDGEIEMLGDYNNGYITTDGELHQDVYEFNAEQYYNIISHFLGEVVAPPVYG